MAFEFNGVLFGDDGSGWIVPGYADLREAFASRVRKLRGIANLNTSPGSFFGQFVTATTEVVHVVAQAALGGVQSTLFARARAANLDGVVDPISTRLPAVASASELTVYGTPGVDVSVGSLVRVNAVSATFETTASSGALPALGNSENYVIEIAPFAGVLEAGNTFSLTVDGTIFTKIVGAFDSAETVLEDLITQVNDAGLSQRAISGGVSPSSDRWAARIAEDNGLGVFPIAFTYSGGNPLPFLHSAAQVPSSAVETGPVVAQPVSLREIVTPIPGWEGVFNQVAAETGRDQESDADFKLRHRANIKSPGASNPDAIRARVLLPIEQGGGGALSCSVEYNKTDFVDGAGNLPHSIRVIVNASADPQAVAQAIWDTRSGGDNMNGAQSVVVLDSEGKAQTVNFDFLEQIYMWVDAVVAPGEGFSTVGDPLQAMREDIAAFIESRAPGRDINPIQLPIENDLVGADRGISQYIVRIGYSLTELGPPIYDKDYYPDPENNAVTASQPILARQRARGDVTRVSVVTP